ncbi:MAG: hypothetical protein U9R55_00115 [Pseudomonadota bacterium]|nr:hypothetical protein [Pseudomonadota bacterium]
MIVLTMLLCCQVSWSAGYVVEKALQSDLGEIQVVRSIYSDGTNGPPSTILLNGKAIFRADSKEPYLELHGLYRFSGGQAVLISQNCGGSGCRVDPLFFIVLSKESKPLVVTNKDFNSETYFIQAKEESGKIIVDLGFFRQKKKVAVLDSGYLSVVLVEVSNQKLTDGQCGSLYKAADACVRDHSSKLGCSSYAKADFSAGGFWGSNSEVWAVRNVSHYPGFNRDGFIQACGSACTTGTLVPYEAFRDQACIQLAPTRHSSEPTAGSAGR